MAKLTKIQRCYNCGIELQTINPNEKGYIRPEILDAYPDGLLLCNDCFENERYNSAPKEANFNKDYDEILNTIIKTKSLVVYVIDILTLEGSFISKLTEKLSNVNVIVVANKIDLLPLNTDLDNIKKYVEHQLRLAHLNVLEVILTSSNDDINVSVLLDRIAEYGKNKDIYFIGTENSGKSSLIYKMLKYYENNSNENITTCSFKNTSLEGLKIPFENKTYIYETPGIELSNSILTKVENSLIKQIEEKKKIVVRKQRLVKNSIIAFGRLAFIELLSDEKTDVLIYANEKISINSLKKIDPLFNPNIKIKNVFPISEKINDLSSFDAYEIEISESDERDLGILGLGWLSFIGNNQKFKIYIPKGVFIYTTRAKVKYVKKRR